jgi:predicted dehydrogenase
MKNLRAVVVGAGFIGPVPVEVLRRIGVDVAGGVGSTPEKSKAVAEQLGIVSDIVTFEQAIPDSAVDAIYLTTPHVLHYEQVKAVLAAGKHCLCEKPLAMNTTPVSNPRRSRLKTVARSCFGSKMGPMDACGCLK